MTTTTKFHLLLLALFIGIYLAPLGVRPLMEPDETRYGEVPREMIQTGEWISPHLNGLRYFEKPPLGYWANALSILALGETPFAIRLPSALSVGLSALLITLLLRQTQPRQPWVSPLAGLILITSLEVAVVGTFSVLDSMLAATLTMTMTCFYLACEAERGSRRQVGYLVGAGVSCGLALLTKGFLALVVPALSVGGYLIWERRFSDLLRLAWLPLLAATLTALPWSLAIHGREPDFWNFFFWHEHVQRFLGGEAAQHRTPFWPFVASTTAMFLPWTFLAPAAAQGLWRGIPSPASRQLIRFCLAWFTLPFLFFSLSSGKLLTYILPCFPPFAILSALGLINTVSDRQRLLQLGCWGAGLCFGGLTLAFIAIQFAGLTAITPAPYATAWQGGLALACLTAMTLLPLAAAQSQRLEGKLWLFGLSLTLLLGLAPFIMPDQAIEKKSPGALLLRQRGEITADTIILADEDSLRSACWFWQRADVFLIDAGGELSYGLGYADAPRRLLGVEGAKGQILAHPAGVILVARARNYRRWAAKFPPPLAVDDNGQDGYVVARY